MRWRLTLTNHKPRRYDPPTFSTVDTRDDALSVTEGRVTFFLGFLGTPPVSLPMADVVKIERID